MNLLTLSLLALGMSMDAFAASLAKGAQSKRQEKIGTNTALKTGLIFGVSEAITPIIGYFLGTLAQDFIKDYDHWISFGLLSALGLYFIYETFFDNQEHNQPLNHQKNWTKTWVTAFATSIDAMIIGISLAFVHANIWLAATIIGIVCTVMASFGMLLGAKIGDAIGSKAQIFGGVVLIAIGVFILYTHLSQA